MSIFVIRTVHTSDQCPTSNSRLRQRLREQGPEIPSVAERLGVKVVVGPLVMGPEHEGVVIVEADRIEAVNDFVMESGLVQWQACRISMAQPMSEVMAMLDRIPPPLH